MSITDQHQVVKPEGLDTRRVAYTKTRNLFRNTPYALTVNLGTSPIGGSIPWLPVSALERERSFELAFYYYSLK